MVPVKAVCPRDVAVGQPIALSSVDIPAQEVGSLAVEMVVDLIAGRRRPETRLLAPILTERDSCRDRAAL